MKNIYTLSLKGKDKETPENYLKILCRKKKLYVNDPGKHLSQVEDLYK